MAPSPSPGVSLPVAAAVVVVMLTTTLKHVSVERVVVPHMFLTTLSRNVAHMCH